MRKIFLQTDHEVRFFGHKLSTWPTALTILKQAWMMHSQNINNVPLHTLWNLNVRFYVALPNTSQVI